MVNPYLGVNKGAAMRYTTPTVPTYRLSHYANVKAGPYPGPYPVYQHTGYKPGVPVPNPAPPKPKPGHWRVSNANPPKPKPRKGGTPYLPANVQGQPIAVTANAPTRSVRNKVRAAVAAGVIAPQHAPKWAQQ